MILVFSTSLLGTVLAKTSEETIEEVHKLLSILESNSGTNHILPKGSVVAFNLAKCPEGWRPYELAYGRFIRGIDPSKDRKLGSTQDDTIQAHGHNVKDSGHAHNMGKFQATKGGYDSGSARSAWSHYSAPNMNVTRSTAGISIDDFGAEETRPKNVALLYCEKK